MAELYHGLWNRVIFDFVTGRISKGKGKVDFIFQYHQAAINIFERPGAGAGLAQREFEKGILAQGSCQVI